jgi:PAS domain S-box-containing protein
MTVHGPDGGSRDELRYFNALLRAQMATSPDGILVADGNLRMLAWNQQFLEMWSLSQATMEAGDGRQAVAAVRDQVCDPEAFEAEIARLYRALDEPEAGVEVHLCDGRVLERHSRGMRDDRGHYWGRCWFYRDITPQRELLEELEQLAEVFRTGAAVMITQPDGTVLRVNEGFEALTGYRAEEMIGHSAEFLGSEVKSPVREQEIREALARDGHWAGERWSRRKDGSVFPQWQTVTVVRGESGEVRHHVVLLNDLTERKLLESERQRRDSAMGELGRILAHQLNQPLTAITNFAEAGLHRLEGTQAPAGLDELLGQVRDQAGRAGEIVEDIRRYLRADNAALRPTNLNSLLHSVLPAVEAAKADQSYQLHLDLLPDLPAVSGDPVPLQECVLNLVNNAVEAASEGPAATGEVHIATRGHGGQVELTIQDNGPGVPAGLEDQVFEPLFTTKEQGTGLGLSICRSVVHSHGGELRVANNATAGATFRLLLPVAAPKGHA